MITKRTFRVMVALSLASAAGRKKLNGIHRFLSEGYDWDMELIRDEGDFTAEALTRASRSRFDGMLIGFAGKYELRAQHADRELPTVFIDESCDPTLSSVRPDHERQGFIAASRLCEMLSGKENVQRHTEIPILTISTRSSTRSESPAGVLVQGALSYIAKNVRFGLDPSAVARHFKVSRRLLDLRFREIAGTSVNAAIREQQLSDVRDMLRRTNNPIGKISELCGFENPNYLKTLFKRRFGVTMRNWRKQNSQK
jgi:AraC-like DNA-binding protein